VGGCCGTTPAHIKAIAEMVEESSPSHQDSRIACSFRKELVEADESNRPLIVASAPT